MLKGYLASYLLVTAPDMADQLLYNKEIIYSSLFKIATHKLTKGFEKLEVLSNSV